MSLNLLGTIRAVHDERATLLQQREQIDVRVATIDAEMAEVRRLLGLPIVPDAAQKTCPRCEQPFVQTSPRQLMCPTCTESAPHRSVAELTGAPDPTADKKLCQNPHCTKGDDGTAKWFVPLPTSAGEFCCRECFMWRSRQAKDAAKASAALPPVIVPEPPAPDPEPLRAHDVPPADLPKRRCAKCYVNFQPAREREYVCPTCLEKPAIGSKPAAASEALSNESVSARDMAILRQLQNGPRDQGQLLKVLPGISVIDLGLALRRLEMRERIVRQGERWRSA